MSHQPATGATPAGDPPRWKRVLDVTLVLAVLPVVLPVAVLVWLWIKTVSRGPAVFRQERIGKGGRPFTMFKFRSMHPEAPVSGHISHVRHLVRCGLPMTKLDLLGDDRLIPGGRFLRNAALDELPQLVNVLLGEMSLVGPRPCLPEEAGWFEAGHRERFRVLPGLTGWWQVNGKNGTTFREMGELDADYSRRSSLGLDLEILARTPGAVVGQMHRHLSRRGLERKVARLSGRSAPSPAPRLPVPRKTTPALAGAAPRPHRHRSWNRRS